MNIAVNDDKLRTILAKINQAESAVEKTDDSCAGTGAALVRLGNAKLALAEFVLQSLKSSDHKES